MAQLPTRPRMRANQHKPAPELGWGRNYDFALRVAPAVRRMGWVEVGVGRRWSGRRCVDLGSRRLRQSERTLGYVRIREPPRAPGGLLGNAEPTSSSLTDFFREETRACTRSPTKTAGRRETPSSTFKTQERSQTRIWCLRCCRLVVQRGQAKPVRNRTPMP